MLRKCIFPAAGYGTRFLPATKAMPKEMLPIVNKPLIQYGVEEALQAGMNNIGFVTGRGKRAIEDHFDITYELEHKIEGTGKEELLSDIRYLINNCSFSYTRQRQMLGLGHAILSGEPIVGEEPFGVILADDLCLVEEGEDTVLKQMSKIFAEHHCSVVAVEEVPNSETNKYGVIAGEEIEPGLVRVSEMVEKPDPENAPSNLAIIGRYILTPDIFGILRETKPGSGGEIQITDALYEQAKQGKVLAYKFKGKRFDCGHAEGYVAATNYYFEKYFKDQ